MRRHRPSAAAILAAAAVAAGLLAPAATPARAQEQGAALERVDLELVLAVDVSPSLSNDEFLLQRLGYAAAFRHPDVIDSIVLGSANGVAVAYFEWGSANSQELIADWTLIRTREDALAFADTLEASYVYPGNATSISGGLLNGARMIETNAYEGARKVIDVSGDGPNNDGPVVTVARDNVSARGIVINGLPLMLNRPGEAFYIANLEQYYEDCVIAGSGSFIAPVRSVEEMAATIRAKLVLEIAGLRVRDDSGRVIPVQFFMDGEEEDRANCLIGEQMRGRGFR